MSDRDPIDPRYDPAFQRGYSGDAPPMRPRRAPADAATAPAVRSAPEPVQPAAVSQGAAPTAFVPRRAEQAETAVEPASASAEVVEDQDPEPAAIEGWAPGQPEPWRNPFLIAVAALGLLCLVAGGIWISRTRDFFDVGAQGSADFWLVMISLVGAPLLLTLGLAITAGVLFFLARYWQRRPPA